MLLWKHISSFGTVRQLVYVALETKCRFRDCQAIGLCCFGNKVQVSWLSGNWFMLLWIQSASFVTVRQLVYVALETKCKFRDCQAVGLCCFGNKMQVSWLSGNWFMLRWKQNASFVTVRQLVYVALDTKCKFRDCQAIGLCCFGYKVQISGLPGNWFMLLWIQSANFGTARQLVYVSLDTKCKFRDCHTRSQ
jgi:hypothetical protein